MAFDMGVHISAQDLAFNSFPDVPRSRIAGSHGDSVFNLGGKEPLYCFPQLLHHSTFYIPASSVQGFQFLHILTDNRFLGFF